MNAGSRRLTAAALAGAAALAVAAPAPASAGSPDRRLCVDRVALRDAPAGFAIAHLRRPQRLRVLGRADGGRWVLVRARRTAVRGWMPSGALCARPVR